MNPSDDYENLMQAGSRLAAHRRAIAKIRLDTAHLSADLAALLIKVVNTLDEADTAIGYAFGDLKFE